MNKCTLVGNLTRDPEVTQTSGGISLCKFSIAVNRTFANANGEREADFLNIVTWRALADNCAKYLTKGSKVAVAGSIQTGSYLDKDGNKRYTTDIVAEDVEFLNRAGGNAADSGASGGYERSATNTKKQSSELKPIEDEGLPF